MFDFEAEVASAIAALTELHRRGLSPTVIEVAGLTRAGKTGSITTVAKRLRREGLNVLDPPEAPEVIARSHRKTSDGKPDPLGYNLRLANYQTDELLTLADDHRQHLVMLDRSVDDRAVMFEVDARLHKFPLEVAVLNMNYLTQEMFTSKIHRALFLEVRTDVALAREQKISKTAKVGENINPATLDMNRTVGRRIFGKLGERAVIIDTSDISEDETALNLLRVVRQTAEMRLRAYRSSRKTRAGGKQKAA